MYPNEIKKTKINCMCLEMFRREKRRKIREESRLAIFGNFECKAKKEKSKQKKKKKKKKNWKHTDKAMT